MPNRFVLSASFQAILLSLAASTISFGAVIYDSGAISLSAPSIQLGRLSRSGTPSDWSTSKAFPGLLNPSISYGYEVFAIPTSPFPYLQISFDDLSGGVNVFASAYLNVYSPSQVGPNYGLDKNYLGDAGSSGNNFGDPGFFQVKLANVNTGRLLVVVNDTSPAGAGLSERFDILVEGFYDAQFNDTTAPIPEPKSLALSVVGLAGVGALVLLRHRKDRSVRLS